MGSVVNAGEQLFGGALVDLEDAAGNLDGVGVTAELMAQLSGAGVATVVAVGVAAEEIEGVRQRQVAEFDHFVDRVVMAGGDQTAGRRGDGKQRLVEGGAVARVVKDNQGGGDVGEQVADGLELHFAGQAHDGASGRQAPSGRRGRPALRTGRRRRCRRRGARPQGLRRRRCGSRQGRPQGRSAAAARPQRRTAWPWASSRLTAASSAARPKKVWQWRADTVGFVSEDGLELSSGGEGFRHVLLDARSAARQWRRRL